MLLVISHNPTSSTGVPTSSGFSPPPVVPLQLFGASHSEPAEADTWTKTSLSFGVASPQHHEWHQGSDGTVAT